MYHALLKNINIMSNNVKPWCVLNITEFFNRPISIYDYFASTPFVELSYKNEIVIW